MRSGTIALLVGILLFQQSGHLPSLYWASILILALPAALLLKPFWRLPAWLVSGFLLALLQAHVVASDSLAAELEGQDLIVDGYIASLPVQQGRRWRFEFDVIRLRVQEQQPPIPGRVRLSWYGRIPQRLQAGDYWRLQVRLKRPHGFMNPGGFDYEGWLFQHRIRATGYVRPTSENQRIKSDWRDYPLQRLRQTLRRHIVRDLGEQSMVGLVLALAIGERSTVNETQWAYLRDTGTTHLMAISGLHIGLIAGLVFALINGLWRFTGKVMLYIPAPKAAAVAAMSSATLYAALAGFAIPTQRALIMLAVVLGAVVLSRPVQPDRTLTWALLLVLVWDPLAVMAAGFWLSFAAVALILFAVNGRLQADLSWWRQWGRVQIGLSLGLAPLLLIFFQQVSLIAPLANLLAVPYVSFLVVPSIMLGLGLNFVIAGAGSWALQLAEILLQGMESVLLILGNWPFASWRSALSGVATICLTLAGLFILLSPRGLPGRWLGGILLLPLFLMQPPRPDEGEAWFSLLDVGQGLAAVVQTRQHVLVFDTGPRFSPHFDTGKAVVAPFLRHFAIHHIDALVISHGDNDHIGGTDSLLQQMPVTRIYSSVPEKITHAAVQPCRQGQTWRWNGVLFQMLHPQDDGSRRNDASCVLRVTAGEQAVLLTGDIEKRAEASLLASQAGLMNADILVAPHHGSKTSSTMAFIEAVSPRYVLYPVGYRNRYGFPHPQVKARYASRKVQSLATASHGAIQFHLGGNADLRPASYRPQARHYWHATTKQVKQD